jgi:NAD(P)-dependent dehydrogenase (short-subunit alcohol dehydrogenase family)
LQIDLSGRTVLVTGGARGIGAAISRAFAAAGARTAVHYGRSETTAVSLAAEIGHGAQAFGADLEDAEAVLGLWSEVVARFGRIDVLVNNAGVAVSSPLEAVDDRWVADWNRTQAVNLLAPGLLCRAAVAHFKEIGGGRIVNIASRAAHRGDVPDYLAYAASKGGLTALTKSIARFCGKDGITAFAIAPGFTRTEMAQDFIDQFGEDYAMKDMALARMTEPEDIAPTVVFLASGLADHATGTTIDMNAASYVR